MSEERKRPGPKRRPVEATKELHIKMPLEVYEAVDRAAGFDPISTYIVRVLRKDLGLEEEQQEG